MTGMLIPVKDDPQEIEVRLGTSYNRVLVEESEDVFSKSAREFNGLSAAFRRKTTRTMEKVHQGSDGEAGSKKVEQEAISGYTMFDVIQPPYNLDNLAKIYEISAPHYAAVKAKVANIVGLGYDFVESDKTKRRFDELESDDEKKKFTKKVARAKQEMFDWIESCNEEDDFMETMAKVWTDYEVTGNGYFEIARKSNGDIGYIGHVPSVTIRIRKQRDGFIQVVSNEAVFFRNFGGDATDPIGNDPRPNELIHIKKYSPSNGYYGIPDIIAARQAVAGNEFASRFNLDYFENKAVPRYVIVVKGGNLSAASQRHIVEFFETGLKGQNHRTVYVPLPADQTDSKTSFEMKPVEAGTQDASFVNYNKINLSNILMAHRVPITKVSMSEGIALAAARDADKTFKEQVCQSEQKILSNKLNKPVAEKTNIFYLKLNELSLTDEDTQSQIDERNVRNNIVLPNEIRARMGLPGIDGGDKSAADRLEDQAAASKTDTGAQTRADAKATANQSRTRDAQRSAGATDSRGEGRNAKGDGRSTA